MMTITKEYPLLQEEDDFYFVTAIHSIGDVTIELDKRLHILNDVVIAGGILSNVDIVVGGAIIADGQCNIKGVQANNVKILGRLYCEGDFLSKESAILAATAINGSAVFNGFVKAISQFTITGDIAINGKGEFNYDIVSNGKVFANGTLDVKERIFANELKINSIETKSYGRFIFRDVTVILYGDGITAKILGRKWVTFDSISSLKDASTDSGSDDYKKRLAENVLSIYENIKNLQFPIEKKE